MPEKNMAINENPDEEEEEKEENEKDILPI